MKKIPQEIKDKVRDACKRHAWNIGVSHYNIDILYMEENEEDGENITLARMRVDHRYLNATLKIYPEFLKDYKEQGDEFLESTIAHEVGHIATATLYYIGTSVYKNEGEMTDAWEQLTEMIGRMSTKIDELQKK